MIEVLRSRHAKGTNLRADKKFRLRPNVQGHIMFFITLSRATTSNTCFNSSSYTPVACSQVEASRWSKYEGATPGVDYPVPPAEWRDARNELPVADKDIAWKAFERRTLFRTEVKALRELKISQGKISAPFRCRERAVTTGGVHRKGSGTTQFASDVSWTTSQKTEDNVSQQHSIADCSASGICEAVTQRQNQQPTQAERSVCDSESERSTLPSFRASASVREPTLSVKPILNGYDMGPDLHVEKTLATPSPDFSMGASAFDLRSEADIDSILIAMTRLSDSIKEGASDATRRYKGPRRETVHPELHHHATSIGGGSMCPASGSVEMRAAPRLGRTDGGILSRGSTPAVKRRTSGHLSKGRDNSVEAEEALDINGRHPLSAIGVNARKTRGSGRHTLVQKRHQVSNAIGERIRRRSAPGNQVGHSDVVGRHFLSSGIGSAPGVRQHSRGEQQRSVRSMSDESLSEHSSSVASARSTSSKSVWSTTSRGPSNPPIESTGSSLFIQSIVERRPEGDEVGTGSATHRSSNRDVDLGNNGGGGTHGYETESRDGILLGSDTYSRHSKHDASESSSTPRPTAAVAQTLRAHQAKDEEEQLPKRRLSAIGSRPSVNLTAASTITDYTSESFSGGTSGGFLEAEDGTTDGEMSAIIGGVMRSVASAASAERGTVDALVPSSLMAAGLLPPSPEQPHEVAIGTARAKSQSKPTSGSPDPLSSATDGVLCGDAAQGSRARTRGRRSNVQADRRSEISSTLSSLCPCVCMKDGTPD